MTSLASTNTAADDSLHLRVDGPIDWQLPAARALLKEAGEREFFQALRQLETLAKELPRIGFAARAKHESIRIGQTPDLDFAPTTIQTLRPDSSGRGQLRQRFFGLLGPNGPLPLHWTQHVRDQTRHADDPTLEAFLNLFHHRMATLFYRAWSSGRGAIQRDRPADDRYAEYLAALSGAMSTDSVNAARGEEEVGDGAFEIRRYFAGRFGGLRRSAEGLQQVVSVATGCPVEVRSFALRQLRLQSENQTVLSRSAQATDWRSAGASPSEESRNVLGASAVLGRTVADRCSGVDIRIGPTDLANFERLIPGGTHHQPLRRVIRDFIGMGFDGRVELLLANDATPSICVGRGGTLGIEAWMGTPRRTKGNVDDCHFQV